MRRPNGQSGVIVGCATVARRVKADLPRESDSALDYEGLLATLRKLEGELVCLLIALGSESRLQTKGIMRRYSYDWAEGFAIGDGGRLLLCEPDFRAARLRTYDGNEHFQITICFLDAQYVIGDPGLVETDEFELFPWEA